MVRKEDKAIILRDRCLEPAIRVVSERIGSAGTPPLFARLQVARGATAVQVKGVGFHVQGDLLYTGS
jgi:hypothetical protein